MTKGSEPHKTSIYTWEGGREGRAPVSSHCYPHGSFSNTSCCCARRWAPPNRRHATGLSRTASCASTDGASEYQHERIVRPCFRSRYLHWRFRSTGLLPLCSARDFRSWWARLGMPALFFDRCTAPVKLPFRECPLRRRRADASRASLRQPARPARLRAFIVRLFLRR